MDTAQAGGNAFGSPLVTLKSGTSNPVGGVILEPPLQEILNRHLRRFYVNSFVDLIDELCQLPLCLFFSAPDGKPLLPSFTSRRVPTSVQDEAPRVLGPLFDCASHRTSFSCCLISIAPSEYE